MWEKGVEVYLFNVVLLATTAVLRLPLPGVDELIQILVMRFFDLLALTVAEAHVAFAAARLTAKRDAAASPTTAEKVRILALAQSKGERALFAARAERSGSFPPRQFQDFRPLFDNGLGFLI